MMGVQEERQQRAEQIVARLRQELRVLLAPYPVDAAYVYGSVARGTATSLSDVDIALLLESSLSPYDRLQLELAVQGDIATAGGVPSADVRSINEAPLMVQGRIVQQGVLVYERDHKHRVRFEVITRKRYFDFAPVARRLGEAFLKHIREGGMRYG
jgi:predicted nucleotidyltransferase